MLASVCPESRCTRPNLGLFFRRRITLGQGSMHLSGNQICLSEIRICAGLELPSVRDRRLVVTAARPHVELDLGVPT
jgi:hypothetical protein